MKLNAIFFLLHVRFMLELTSYEEKNGKIPLNK